MVYETSVFVILLCASSRAALLEVTCTIESIEEDHEVDHQWVRFSYAMCLGKHGRLYLVEDDEDFRLS